MPKITKEKKRRRRPNIVLYELPGKGNIDPQLIRKTIIEVIDRRRQREADERRSARAQAKTPSSPENAE